MALFWTILLLCDILFLKSLCVKTLWYTRHGQSAALQLIFAPLGPVPLRGKANNTSPFKQNLTKFVLNSSQEESRRLKKNSALQKYAAPVEKWYAKLGHEQKSLATPVIYYWNLIRTYSCCNTFTIRSNENRVLKRHEVSYNNYSIAHLPLKMSRIIWMSHFQNVSS